MPLRGSVPREDFAVFAVVQVSPPHGVAGGLHGRGSVTVAL